MQIAGEKLVCYGALSISMCSAEHDAIKYSPLQKTSQRVIKGKGALGKL